MLNLAKKFEYLNDPKESPEKKENPENEEIARKIAGLGNFELIEAELEEKNLLEGQIERVKEKFSDKINQKDFPSVNQVLWELLTILELYNPATAEHCIQTYLLAKEKIEKALYQDIVLAEIIQNEGVPLERFYLSCLVHDIGKVEVPALVLENSTTHEQWKEIFLQQVRKKEISPFALEKLGLDKSAAPSEEEALSIMREKNLSANQLVPIKLGMNENEAEELLEMWGLDGEKLSLRDIVDGHAKSSRKILEEKNLPVASAIAGQHHEKSEEFTIFPTSTASLQISSDLADIMHLADVQEALTSKRSYKESFLSLKTSEVLIEHADQGKISKVMAFFWIKDNFQKQDTEDLSAEEKIWQEKIEFFLNDFEKGSSKKLLEDWMDKHKLFAQAA